MQIIISRYIYIPDGVNSEAFLKAINTVRCSTASSIILYTEFGLSWQIIEHKPNDTHDLRFGLGLNVTKARF